MNQTFSILSTVILLFFILDPFGNVPNYSGEEMNLLISLLIAWALSTVVFLISPMLYRVLKDKGLKALERLMGMLLLIMAVQMFIDGLRGAFGI